MKTLPARAVCLLLFSAFFQCAVIIHTENEEMRLIDITALPGEWTFDWGEYQFKPSPRTSFADSQFILKFSEKGRYYGFVYFPQGDSTRVQFSDSFYVKESRYLILADDAEGGGIGVWRYYKITALSDYYMSLYLLKDCIGSDCMDAASTDTTTFWKNSATRLSL